MQKIRVFVFFTLAYLVSYLFRGINIGLEPYLINDLHLRPGDLGVLTSLYFLGFAAVQLPAGVLLDRFGARRVVAVLLVIAGLGAVIFAAAHNLGMLMAGRLLVGVGSSACLGGAFKALAEWFPRSRLPLLNGLILALGGLGGVMTGAPLAILLQHAGWRSVCFGFALFALAVGGLVRFATPREPVRVATHTTLRGQLQGVAHIFQSPVFWIIALFTSATQGVFYAMQSLWVAPFLRESYRMSEFDAQRMVSLIGIAMMAGSVGSGVVASMLKRIGVSLYATCGVGMLVFMVVQVAAIARLDIWPPLLWSAYGAFGVVGILGYAMVAEYFPGELIGRATTALTLVLFGFIFAVQIGVGAVANSGETLAATFHLASHQFAWVVLLLIQAATGLVYAAGFKWRVGAAYRA